jgi:hypothetical protein
MTPLRTLLAPTRRKSASRRETCIYNSTHTQFRTAARDCVCTAAAKPQPQLQDASSRRHGIPLGRQVPTPRDIMTRSCIAEETEGPVL